MKKDSLTFVFKRSEIELIDRAAESEILRCKNGELIKKYNCTQEDINNHENKMSMITLETKQWLNNNKSRITISLDLVKNICQALSNYELWKFIKVEDERKENKRIHNLYDRLETKIEIIENENTRIELGLPTVKDFLEDTLNQIKNMKKVN